MEVRANKVKIWRKDYKTKDGKEFYRYSVSVSKQNEEGKYVNAYIPIAFSKKVARPEKIDNGAFAENLVGFLSVDSYTDKDGHERNTPMIVVMEADFDTGFSEVSDDIDF